MTYSDGSEVGFENEAKITFSCRDEVKEWLEKKAEEETLSVSSVVERLVVEKYQENSDGGVKKKKVALSLEDAKDSMKGMKSSESDGDEKNGKEDLKEGEEEIGTGDLTDGEEKEDGDEEGSDEDGYSREQDEEIEDKNVPDAEEVAVDDEEDSEESSNPEDKLKQVLGGRGNPLKKHDDKWEESDDGYEVELPDDGTENVRTKDDVRSLLMKHYG